MTDPNPGAGPAGLEPSAAEELLARAREARRHAYAPYSRFPVGAALLAEDGRVFTGVNVENASFGLTICAERTAMTKAVSEGVRGFRAVAVVGPQDEEPCTPCGSCRQFLHELGPEMQVVTPGGAGRGAHQAPLRDLLPGAFGGEDLRRAARGGR